jgi:hypothetical protein
MIPQIGGPFDDMDPQTFIRIMHERHGRKSENARLPKSLRKDRNWFTHEKDPANVERARRYLRRQ